METQEQKEKNIEAIVHGHEVIEGDSIMNKECYRIAARINYLEAVYSGILE